MATRIVDVCIVGAGAAGIACAQGLARQGASVTLIERLDPMPNALKAEKIDGEAVLSLLRLGFQPAVEAAFTPLHSVSIFFGERSLGTLPLSVPDAGGHYHVLINSLRAHVDPRVDFRRGTKVLALAQRSDCVEVVTDKGEHIACRLLVMATGDARQLIEPLGAKYDTQMPHQVFVAAFTMEGSLGDSASPVDTQTYHHPVAGGPIAYATFFRLGGAHRANIFCPGPISEEWQRDLKQRPLEALSEHNRLLAAASKGWQMVSPVMIRKIQVFQLQPPDLPRVVVLGDAAHTIDPAGGGGLTFSLLETEVLLDFHIGRWLREDDCGHAAIQAFYDDPRRVKAVQKYFGRGQYIFALNHDMSAKGHLRRMWFFLQTRLASRGSGRPARPAQIPETSWQLPAPYLYES
ncbi:MAG TPA: FAD-dependent oxidoreductase [Chloroflexia bacterium]|jgi:2-polyprenyl-6-methoxyphenol hydroxylase-like FAD-dependent oxidoreductase